MTAVFRGNERMVDILLRYGANPRESDAQVGTCLEVAAMKGFHSIVQSLLHAGVDVNSNGIFHRTALHAACIHDKFEIVELLLQRGASTNGAESATDNSIEAAASFDPFDDGEEFNTTDISTRLNTAHDLSAPEWRDQHSALAPNTLSYLPSEHLMQSSSNQSTIPDVVIDLLPAPVFGESPRGISGHPHQDKADHNLERGTQKTNVDSGPAQIQIGERVPRSLEDEQQIGARLLESLKVAPGRGVKRLASDHRSDSLRRPIDISAKRQNSSHVTIEDRLTTPVVQPERIQEVRKGIDVQDSPLPISSSRPRSRSSANHTLPSISNLVNQQEYLPRPSKRSSTSLLPSEKPVQSPAKSNARSLDEALAIAEHHSNRMLDVPSSTETEARRVARPEFGIPSFNDAWRQTSLV